MKRKEEHIELVKKGIKKIKEDKIYKKSYIKISNPIAEIKGRKEIEIDKEKTIKFFIDDVRIDINLDFTKKCVVIYKECFKRGKNKNNSLIINPGVSNVIYVK